MEWMHGGTAPFSPSPLLNKLAGDLDRGIRLGFNHHGGAQAMGISETGEPELFLEASVGEGHM